MNTSKTFLLISAFFICLCSGHALADDIFNNFFENPAGLAVDYSNFSMMLPATPLNISLANSNLNMSQISPFSDSFLFRSSYQLTENDKELLTARDLDLHFALNTNLLYLNVMFIDFSVSTCFAGNVNLMSSEFARIMFYGNEVDSETKSNVGEGSQAVAFTKTMLRVGIPYEIPIKSVVKLSFGLNLNVYTPIAYFSVPESSQTFSDIDGTIAYDMSYKLIASDTDSLVNPDNYLKPAFGFGLGSKVKILDFIDIHLFIDDILAELTFDDLYRTQGQFSASVSLDPFDMIYDEITTQQDNESSAERISYKYSLPVTYLIGTEVALPHGIKVIAKYKNCLYDPMHGFTAGVGYDLVKIIPLWLTFTFNESVFARFKTGINLKNFKLSLAYSQYIGSSFTLSGMGVDLGMQFVF
jgi:hypothetical protein